MTFKSIPSDDATDARLQRGIETTLDNVSSGTIRRYASVDNMRAAMYLGETHLCIVALNDPTSGLVLRSATPVMDNNQIFCFPLGDPDPDYQVGDPLFYFATRKADGELNEAVIALDGHPLLQRLREVVANLVRQGIDLRHASLDLAVVTDSGWKRRQVNLGPRSAEATEANTIARAIETTLSNVSNGIVSSSYTSQQELREAMMYDGVVVLGVVAHNDRHGVAIRLLSHRFSDDYACAPRFAMCRDRELTVGDLVFHTMSALSDGSVRETIITLEAARERTSSDPARYFSVENVWSSYSAMLTHIKAFFALFLAEDVDLKRLWFDPATLNSTAPLRIAGRIDLRGNAEN